MDVPVSGCSGRRLIMPPAALATAPSRALVVFRSDASVQIGTGHVMRCLTLAEALRENGTECLFLCRPHQGHLMDLISARGHRVKALPAFGPESAGWTPRPGPPHAAWLGTDQATDAADSLRALEGEERAAWLVVDHYALDREWQTALRPVCDRLMVIDDLADRPHDCDLLLDPNIGRSEADYTGLVPDGVRILLGPRYALLRPEFAAHRAESLARRAQPELRRLLVTLGGVDKDNITCQVLDALDASALTEALEITVVMGPHAPWLAAVRERAQTMRRPTRVLVGVSDMARLMTESDLAIGAAGSTAWERCCLGLPTIQLVLAENQREAALAFSRLDAAVSMPSLAGLHEGLSHVIRALHPDRLRALSNASARICDGRGAQIAVELLLGEATDTRRIA